MQFRLRTLLLVLGIVPPAIGLAVAIFGDPALRWQLNDPILLLGAGAWLFTYTRLVLLRPSGPNNRPQVLPVLFSSSCPGQPKTRPESKHKK